METELYGYDAIISHYGLVENKPEIAKLVEGNFITIQFRLDIVTGDYTILLLEKPTKTGYFLNVEEGTRDLGWWKYENYFYTKPISHDLLTQVVIPVLQEMRKIGFVYGWTEEFCKELDKTIALA
ncbi:MAG: hypothetical protein PHR68_05340 [Candidatus Gracilibacteria bacterium]|nr:hypothetical protein [Candidatus Gracilibacteria bacterium]